MVSLITDNSKSPSDLRHQERYELDYSKNFAYTVLRAPKAKGKVIYKDKITCLTQSEAPD